MTYTKTILPSGLRLITIPMKSTKAVTVFMAVQAGLRYETKSINGISHFLEHMMFKGTKRRPTTLAISEELDSIGGEYNAFTSKEWTGYYIKAAADNLDMILDVISDIVLNSELKQEEVEKEKRVILAEMNLYQDTPARYVDDILEALLYGNQPQGWKIIGEPATVSKLTSVKLKTYFSKRYNGKNSAVIVAGYFDNALLKNKIKKYFSSFTKAVVINHKAAVAESQDMQRIKVYYKDTDQSHLNMALRAYHINHKNLPALKVLNIILGGNMSSRLFIHIREQEGLCYYIHSHIEAYSDCGYLSIKAGVDNRRIKRAILLIIKELILMRDKGVSSEELYKAKECARGRLAISLETSSDFAFWIGEQEIVNGSIKTEEDVMAEIDSVSQEDVKRVAEEIIANNRFNMAIIGPYSKKDQFIRLMKRI